MGEKKLAAIPYHQHPKGRLIQENPGDLINWFVANGFMPKAIDVQAAVDLSFLR